MTRRALGLGGGRCAPQAALPVIYRRPTELVARSSSACSPDGGPQACSAVASWLQALAGRAFSGLSSRPSGPARLRPTAGSRSRFCSARPPTDALFRALVTANATGCKGPARPLGFVPKASAPSGAGRSRSLHFSTRSPALCAATRRSECPEPSPAVSVRNAPGGRALCPGRPIVLGAGCLPMGRGRWQIDWRREGEIELARSRDSTACRPPQPWTRAGWLPAGPASVGGKRAGSKSAKELKISGHCVQFPSQARTALQQNPRRRTPLPFCAPFRRHRLLPAASYSTCRSLSDLWRRSCGPRDAAWAARAPSRRPSRRRKPRAFSTSTAHMPSFSEQNPTSTSVLGSPAARGCH